MVGLLLIESSLLALIGAAAGAILLYGLLFALRPLVNDVYGLYLPIGLPSPREWAMLAAVAAAGAAAGLPPAIRSYRLSLADGMTIKL